jgi:hypothetical protein
LKGNIKACVRHGWKLKDKLIRKALVELFWISFNFLFKKNKILYFISLIDFLNYSSSIWIINKSKIRSIHNLTFASVILNRFAFNFNYMIFIVNICLVLASLLSFLLSLAFIHNLCLRLWRTKLSIPNKTEIFKSIYPNIVLTIVKILMQKSH